MIKTAQARESEIRGVLAAMVDGGLIEIDTPENFSKVAAEVNYRTPGDYDIDTIFGVVDGLLQEVESGQTKTAEVEDVAEAPEADNFLSALGSLTLTKVAGQISEADFDKAVLAICKEAGVNAVDTGKAIVEELKKTAAASKESK